ncbi:hypothetical protein EST38_g6533 [Candolleomyces aberdarensis]|uniref:Uncharacterized protein n=1 Tax=Candolleomyces aberdarensis TaxID=2316362 RepID=A0A4Q2DJG1_9AGAR|nr:hypothetical protein EST38_g6533 [Candolleomyces aberdarensis]
MLCILDLLNLDQDDGSSPSLHSITLTEREISPQVENRNEYNLTAVEFDPELPRPVLWLSGDNTHRLNFGFKRYCATLGIIKFHRDPACINGSSESSDLESSTGSILHESEDSFDDASDYQGDVEDLSSAEELSPPSEWTFDDTSDYQGDAGDHSTAELLSSLGEGEGSSVDISDDASGYASDTEDQSTAEVYCSLSGGSSDGDASDYESDAIDDESSAEGSSSLAEALDDDESVPADFVRRRYPSLFIPPTAIYPLDGDNSDNNVTDYYQSYSSGDFKRLAREKPGKFLRVAVPYLDISDGLGDPFMLFKEWMCDFEAHHPWVVEADEDSDERHAQAWVRVIRYLGKAQEWIRVSNLINCEFRERYPLYPLLSDEMQDIIRDTLVKRKEGEDPNMKVVREYWLKMHEEHFPWDLGA